MKNIVKKTNVAPYKSGDLIISDYSAVSRQRALILAAVFVSWSAIALGPKTAQAQSAPPYPIGVWGQFGVAHDIDPGLVANLGIVGIGISDDWNNVNTAPGVYDWSTLDAKIAEAKAAGFQYISLAVTDSASQTPTWLLDSLPPDQKIALIDPASTHDTFCQPILTALPWNATFHQARLDLIAAMGAKYTNDPAIVAVNMAAFANHNTQDWNVQDTVGTIECPGCPQPPPTLCGSIIVDQPAQWLAVGWTEQQMLQIGKEICDAAAAAFPNQNIKLPIGGLDITYLDFSGGTYSTLCRDIENYVYGNASLGIPPQPYANRFYMQRNTVDANWGDGTQYDTFTPGFDSERYIKYMIRAHAAPLPPWTTPRQAGLQMVSAASLGDTTNCRQGGGPTGPCGPTCDPVCVMQASLDVARTYNTAFIEIWAQDSANPAFYDMIRAATIAMGGTPRPTVPAVAHLNNISTRALVQTGDDVIIGGFIVQGTGQKTLVVRAIGPSLAQSGITNPLQNPTLELHDQTGAMIAFNDNWIDAPNKQDIINSGLAPTNNLESAILTSLNPGNYTAIVRGATNGTGVALVEGYDLNMTAGSKLGNVSTRALVQTGDNVMIGGFIVTQATRVIIRAIGPSLTPLGVSDALANPQLELHDISGALIGQNDDWQTTEIGGIITSGQVAAIQSSGLAPTNPAESAIIATLPPGNYTAIVRGVNNTTGNALVEVYDSLQ